MVRIIGIDLGTTNTAAAWWDGRQASMIPNDRGKNLTPSIVAFSREGEVLVGESARNQAVTNTERTIIGVKRNMGTSNTFVVDGVTWSPEDVAGRILASIRSDAERFLGERVTSAVIAVPAHFTEAQRQATIRAGESAGLDVRRIVNEPTAAALSHASTVTDTQRLLVYDLGGGTFDATCLLQEDGRYTVKSTIGDNHLGGIDFDEVLLDEAFTEFEKQSGFAIRGVPALEQQLRDGVERAKIELSSREYAEISLPFIGNGGRPVHLSWRVSRDDFSSRIAPLLQKTVKLTMTAVRESGFGLSGIDGIIVSGGSTRIPLVQTYLKRAFGLSEVRMLNPDETVALGAAVYGGMLERGDDHIRVSEITSRSLGVETEGGSFVPIIARNTSIPVRRRRVFTTISDNQRTIEVHALQGDSELASENASLGRFLLSGVKQARKGTARIEVGFSVDEDGLVHVDACDVDTGARQTVVFEQAAGDASGASGDYDAVRGLRNRVQMFYDAVRGSLDSDFDSEVRHYLVLTDEVLAEGDTHRRMEIGIALEALADELAMWLDAGELRDAGA